VRLRWTDGALADVHRHWVFLAMRDVEYADRVEARLKERAQALLRSPNMGRPVPGSDLRALSVPDIQHVLTYRIGEGEILVTGVDSTREDRESK